jgi:hypothetical protein
MGQFLRAFEGFPQIVPKSHKFPYVVLDFLQFLSEKFAYTRARRLTFISQAENLLNLVQGKPERLRLSDEAKPVSGFRSVYPVACGGPVGGRQESKSLIKADCLHTHARRTRYLANERFLFHRENLHPIVHYRVKRFLETPGVDQKHTIAPLPLRFKAAIPHPPHAVLSLAIQRPRKGANEA